MFLVDVLSVLRLSRIDGLDKASYVPLGTRATVASSRQRHELYWQGGMWVCMKCLYRTSSSSSHSRVPCKRLPALSKMLDPSLVHRLWSSPLHGGGTIIYCSTCWHYASPFPRNLLRPCCKPRRGFRPCARFHLVNRRHPISRARVLHPCRLHV